MEGIGQGFAGVFFGAIIVVGLIIGGVTFGITKWTEKKELVVNKPLVPEKRLVTDGKKVDTVYVYKIR